MRMLCKYNIFDILNSTLDILKMYVKICLLILVYTTESTVSPTTVSTTTPTTFTTQSQSTASVPLTTTGTVETGGMHLDRLHDALQITHRHTQNMDRTQCSNIVAATSYLSITHACNYCIFQFLFFSFWSIAHNTTQRQRDTVIGSSAGTDERETDIKYDRGLYRAFIHDELF